MKRVLFTVASATMMFFGLQAQNNVSRFEIVSENSNAQKFGLQTQNNVQTINYDGGCLNRVTPLGYEVTTLRNGNTVQTKKLPPEVVASMKSRADDEYCTLTFQFKEDEDWELVWVEYPIIIEGVEYVWIEFGYWWDAVNNAVQVPVLKGVNIDAVAFMWTPWEDIDGLDTSKDSHYTIDQIFIDGDQTFNIDFDECVNFVSYNFVDPNNTPVNDLDRVVWMSSGAFFSFGEMMLEFQMVPTNLIYEKQVCFNNLSNRHKYFLDYILYDGTDWMEISYTIKDGITESIVATNDPADFTHHMQMFNAYEESEGPNYSYLGINKMYYGYTPWGFNGIRYWGADENITHDRTKPFSLYTNTKITENPQHGDINIFFIPIYYNDLEHLYAFNQKLDGAIWSAPFGINNSGQKVIHPFRNTKNFSWAEVHENFIELTTNDPLAEYYEDGELQKNDYRTPHLHYVFRGYTPLTLPVDELGLGGFLFNGTVFQGFIGFYDANGEQRYFDKKQIVNVKLDGTKIYEDYMWIFNYDFKEEIAIGDEGLIEIEILNENVYGYGVPHFNHTKMTMDLTKEDPVPPTITVLRVRDENGKIAVGITNLFRSKLEISAGDFYVPFNMETGEWYDAGKYNGRPNIISVQWSVDEVNFNPMIMNLVTDEKVHPAYGDYFEVGFMSLMMAGVENKWVTLKITLTDFAGNKQEQTLQNLFYVGDLISSIEKNSIAGKSVAYPNPFNGIVTIETEKPLTGETYFEIYDNSGRIIHQQKVNSETKTFTFNGKHLIEGIYFYGIYNQGNAITGKIVKQ
jgi:hypothetical protein